MLSIMHPRTPLRNAWVFRRCGSLAVSLKDQLVAHRQGNRRLVIHDQSVIRMSLRRSASQGFSTAGSPIAG
jgi:hypothetical protein